jgi:hypothetical protein
MKSKKNCPQNNIKWTKKEHFLAQSTPLPPLAGNVLLLKPPDELPSFERNKIMKQKIKSYYFP